MCHFFSRFKRTSFVECPFLKAYSFCDKTLLPNVHKVFEIIGNKLTVRCKLNLPFLSCFLKAWTTSAIFNSSVKEFIDMHPLRQFSIGTYIAFLTILIISGDIFRLHISKPVW